MCYMKQARLLQSENFLFYFFWGSCFLRGLHFNGIDNRMGPASMRIGGQKVCNVVQYLPLSRHFGGLSCNKTPRSLKSQATSAFYQLSGVKWPTCLFTNMRPCWPPSNIINRACPRCFFFSLMNWEHVAG